MNVVFNSDFLDDIKKLGNSVKLTKYYLEDYTKSGGIGHTLKDIIEISNGYSAKTLYGQGNNDDTFVRGIWDKDRKEFITHFSLPDSIIANVVRYNESTEEPEELEYEVIVDGEKDGRGLIRIIRYVYSINNGYKTAFLLTGDIGGSIRNYTIDPIRINQDRDIIIISFPEDTKANILPYTIEDDTKFLEGFGIEPGINIFLNSEEENLVSRDSFYKYLRVYTGDLQNFQIPYIDSSGKEIKRNYIYRDYKKLNIDCAGLFKYTTPNTKPGLSHDGGVLNIYGTAEFDEYVLLGDELKYLGKGTEPINNIPNVDIEFSGNGELKDVRLDTEIIREEAYSAETEVNKFRVSYGRYEGQEDPSKLVNFKLNFYDPILNITKEVKSKKIKITQLDTVLSEWEIFDRTTRYFEDEVPVYMFPWQSGSEHSFKIRTTLSNLSMIDFSMEYENEILNDLFKYDIQFTRDNRNYPYYIYTITLINKTDNEDLERWLPILNGNSTLLLATLKLNGYEDYQESFYMVQSPKADNIELHENPNNSNVEIIDFATDEIERTYYPVAIEARTDEEIGIRNTWKVFSNDEDVVVSPNNGKLNPNNIEELTRELKVIIERQPQTIEPLIFNDLVIERIRENEVNMNLEEANWRNIISLSKISIPVRKDGIKTDLIIPDELVFEEINLYRVNISSNGPVACYLNYEEGFDNKFTFFDPYSNQITGNNYFYNRDPEMPLYIALTNLDTTIEDLIVVGNLEVVIAEEEPNWINGRPDCFDSDEAKRCILYQGKHEKIVDYVSGDNGYIFLDSYTSKPVRYISTRTPERTLTHLTHLLEEYRPLNNIIIERRDPIIEMNLEDRYLDHLDLLQNPNNLTGFYPISPSAIFTAAQSYYNVSKNFFVFRKALGPDFYSNDTSYDRIIYLPATVESSANKHITIQSRYHIENEDFITRPYDENIPFSTLHSEEVLSERDFKYKYSITIAALSDNTEGQRTLGTLTITSRIYKENFINVNTANSYGIPYYNFSQDEVDRIVPPRTLNITVIQLGTGTNNGEIELIGNRDLYIDVRGENREFKVISNIQTQEPNIANIINCSINNLTTEGFIVSVPSIYDLFNPCPPDDPYAYVDISRERNISADVRISPVDPNYDDYEETLSFIQPAIDTGIIYSSSESESKLFIGDKNYRIVETVSSSENSFLSFLGLFSTANIISSGDAGTLTELEIVSNDKENNSYVVLNEKVYWYDTGNNKENIKFTFPINNTDKTIERTYTITYKVRGVVIHKITLVIEHQSASGYFKCDNNMYVLSHGECLNKDENDLGWFDFETNIPKQQLSISLSSDLLDQVPVIQEKSSGKYKVSIKLKPNLTEDKRTIILNFMREGKEVIKSVIVSQGYYCTKLFYPDSNNYVINNGSIGNTSNYIDTPTRNETQYGTRKSFIVEITRSEPNYEGRWSYDSNLASAVEIKVSNYVWSLLSVSSNQGSSQEDEENSRGNIGGETEKATSNYFTSYSSVIINSRIPYLENQYNVNNLYYGHEIKNKITVTLSIGYPDDDILYGYSINPVFNIYQNKLGEVF